MVSLCSGERNSFQLCEMMLCSEIKLHVEVHARRSHEGRVISQVQSQWRVACQLM